MKNAYEVLGVARDADADTIRKAYKKLAKKYHPDVNKTEEAVAKFKEINGAYDAIGDEEKRKMYDEFGEASTRPGFDPEQMRQYTRGRSGGGFPGGAGGFPGGQDFDFGGAGGGAGMDDILSQLFGEGSFGGGRRVRRGRDQQATLQIDPMLAIRGGETNIRMQRPSGEVETLKVRIPAGVNNGGTLHLAGQGLPPPGGGPCGDLHIKLEIPEHPLLRRAGNDLEMDVPITVLEAIKGATITVPTPTGDVKVTVPAGVATGAKLRLKGRGIQKSPPGDLFLVLRPTVPRSEDPEVIAAAERIEQAYEGDLRQHLSL
jgi:curved DNA-binding protein